ncbi:MAG: DUF302 domain-containing protein [Cytophagales bacterium]|nr:DUF302 domain-containing protein [Cytophagales bacterium]
MNQPPGVLLQPSPYSVTDTIQRLENFFREHGITVYARIDQQAELQKAGLSIPPLWFLLFGNPRGGGPVMVRNPVAALDLPLKIVVWEDDGQRVWLACNDAAYLKGRYGLPDPVAAPLDVTSLLDKALGS